MPEHVTHQLLKEFLEAFNRHDLDSIMGFFADDCVFYMPRGAKPRAIGMPGRMRFVLAWQNDLRGFPMFIMEKISTGSVVILESLNGPSPALPGQGNTLKCAVLTCWNSRRVRLPARIHSGKYWSDTPEEFIHEPHRIVSLLKG